MVNKVSEPKIDHVQRLAPVYHVTVQRSSPIARAKVTRQKLNITVQAIRTNGGEIKVGDRVRGVKGRDSEDWHGEVKAQLAPCVDGTAYFSVYWEERASSLNPLLKKNPEIGMRQDQLRRRS